MYTTRFVRLFSIVAAGCVLHVSALPAWAQSAPPEPHQHPPAVQTGSDPSQPQHDAQHMHMQADPDIATPPTREGSGTSWLPDETPMSAIHAQAGDWTLMAHGNAFLQYLHDTGDRGSHQFGSINWFMGMADRTAGSGHLGLRGMISLEPWTVRGCGYPDLLASGEVCQGEAIHDRQHPHDLFMELAVTYDRPLAGTSGFSCMAVRSVSPPSDRRLFRIASRRCPTRLRRYPSLARRDAHHIRRRDRRHVSHSMEGQTSVFNGREPDENRTDFDIAQLDSCSGRVWFLPTKRWALQASAGHLTDAEAGHDGGARVNVNRVTASATYHRALRAGSLWASPIGWGRNIEPGNRATNAFLAETSVTLNGRDGWFGRFELSEKSGHDLAIESADLFTVAKLAAGYTRYFQSWNGLKPGFGAGLSAGIVPESLHSIYGSRVNPGVALFVTLRHGERGM